MKTQPPRHDTAHCSTRSQGEEEEAAGGRRDAPSAFNDRGNILLRRQDNARDDSKEPFLPTNKPLFAEWKTVGFTDADVLCDAHFGLEDIVHPGNRFYDRLLQQHYCLLDNYQHHRNVVTTEHDVFARDDATTTEACQQQQVAQTLMNVVTCQGRRFLRRDPVTAAWHEASVDDILAKIRADLANPGVSRKAPLGASPRPDRILQQQQQQQQHRTKLEAHLSSKPDRVPMGPCNTKTMPGLLAPQQRHEQHINNKSHKRARILLQKENNTTTAPPPPPHTALENVSALALTSLSQQEKRENDERLPPRQPQDDHDITSLTTKKETHVAVRVPNPPTLQRDTGHHYSTQGLTPGPRLSPLPYPLPALLGLDDHSKSMSHWTTATVWGHDGSNNTTILPVNHNDNDDDTTTNRNNKNETVVDSGRGENNVAWKGSFTATAAAAAAAAEKSDKDAHTTSKSSEKNMKKKRSQIIAEEAARNQTPEERWEEVFQEMKDFKQKFGHCNVQCDKGGTYGRLYRWVRKQKLRYRAMPDASPSRRMYKERINNKVRALSAEEFQKLTDLGVDLTSSRQHGLWHERYEELLDFKEKYGHVNVPRQRGGAYQSLYDWLGKQQHRRRAMLDPDQSRRTPLTEEEHKKLVAAGVQFQVT